MRSLSSVVLEKKFLKDVGKLHSSSHTGALEVFHSEMLQYVPKRKHFCYQGMVCRTQLCVMDHNIHLDREQVVNQWGAREGLPRYSHVCPKGRNHWVAKRVKTAKTYPHLPKLVSSVLGFVMSGTKPTPMSKPYLPLRITGVERPSLDESLKYCRFETDLQ